jgi:transposase
MLARFGATMQPDIPAAKDQTIDSLDELLAARRALVKDRTAALNRAKTRTLGLLKSQSSGTASRSKPTSTPSTTSVPQSG